MKQTISLMATVLFGLVLSGCGGAGGSSAPSYTLSTSIGTGGSLSPTSIKVKKNKTTSLTVTPNSGYSIDSVSGCGGSLSGSTYTTGTITADCTVSASFTINSYTVSTNAGANGSIGPSSATVVYNTTTSFTVTPESGYAISSISGCGGTLSGDSYTTGAVTTHCTVTANFAIAHTVSTSAGANGSISPSNATVADGNTTSFTVTPDTGYAIASVSGCDGSLSGSTYTTGAITAGCTVTASFALAFTWEGGSDTINATGVYGTLGTPATTNVPGSRYGTVTWTDASGNLWLFGGNGRDSVGNNGTLNDLWEYSNGQWIWMGGVDTGANNQGTYGTLGTPAASNIPGARNGSVSWIDASGKLWLFGGNGRDSVGNAGRLNDLWEYDTSIGQWTWQGGSNTVNSQGTYSAPGVAATNNIPGSRTDAVSWIDASGNVWLFGGYGYDSVNTTQGNLNDLWLYSAGKWTWMSGSNTINASGVYGTPGVASPSNLPGARNSAVRWTDASGNLWLFGGYGRDSAGTLGDLNDLWEYDISNHQWTWVGGTDTVNASSVYGTLGEAATGNTPGAREKSVTWTDASGNLWLFGGMMTNPTRIYYNDLWQYNVSSGQWTWVGGSDTINALGSYGTPDASNMPGARWGAVGWTDASGNFLLFGGYGYDHGTVDVSWGYLNDLWSFHP